MKTISYTGKAGGALYHHHHHHHDSTDNDRDDNDDKVNDDDKDTGMQKLFHLEFGAVLSIEIAALQFDTSLTFGVQGWVWFPN